MQLLSDHDARAEMCSESWKASRILSLERHSNDIEVKNESRFRFMADLGETESF